jgi:hypothetical protein
MKGFFNRNKKVSTNNAIAIEQKLRAMKIENVNNFDELKKKIQQIETKIVLKKTEYDTSRGSVKEMVMLEIEQMFKELDSLKQNQLILNRNINKITQEISKLEQMRDSGLQGLNLDEIDQLALNLEDNFSKLQEVDLVSKDLERVVYHHREENQPELLERLSALAEDSVLEKEIPISHTHKLKDLLAEED